MNKFDDVDEKARRLVQEAIEAEATDLDLSDDEFFYELRRLPPEISQLSNLESLSIACLGELDLSPLRGLGKLKRLHMRGGIYGNHGPLPFPKLEELLISSKYASMPDLSASPRLKRLTLKHTDERLGLAGLEANKDLMHLDLGDVVSQPSLFENVARLQSLKELRAVIDDSQAEVVGQLAGLETLRLAGAAGLTEAGLQQLARLSSLRVLELAQTGISDLTPLVTFTSVLKLPPVLEELTYSATPATDADSVLAELSRLEDVRLSTELTLRYLNGLVASRARLADRTISAKDEALSALDALAELVNAGVPSNPSIGHNNPPEAIDREIPDAIEELKLASVVRKLKANLEASALDRKQVEVGQGYLAKARDRLLALMVTHVKEAGASIIKDASRKIFTLENLWLAVTWAWRAIRVLLGGPG